MKLKYHVPSLFGIAGYYGTIMNSHRAQTIMPLHETDNQDLTLSSDITTIPPPTDFDYQANSFGQDSNHYPSLLNRHLEAWHHENGCHSARLSGENRSPRGTILPDGQKNFSSAAHSSSVDKAGVHFDLSM